MKLVNSLVGILVLGIVVFYALRYFRGTREGFATPYQAANCKVGELKLIYDEGAPGQKVFCFNKAETFAQFPNYQDVTNQNRIFQGPIGPAGRYPDVTALFPTQKPTRIATGGDCVRAEIYPEKNFRGTPIIQKGRNDNMKSNGQTQSVKVGSVRVYTVDSWPADTCE